MQTAHLRILKIILLLQNGDECMLVKNIIKMSAEYLDLKEVVKYLNNEIDSTADIADEIANLMLAINMVNNNIASSYIELLAEKKLYVSEDVTQYSAISNRSIIDVKKVLSLSGKKINFKILPEGLKIEFSGDVVIEYSYFPDMLNLADEINYYLKMNEITFAVGVVAEYLYIKGDVDDAYVWDKRFKNTIFNLIRPRRNIVLPARRW